MADILKKFGRYYLLDQVAQGGMAEIYRARLSGKDGAGRLIVIKRIQAGFGENREFLQMFRSEIKTTMGFNHPNIVQLYDFGDEIGQPYIAMELVDGKNLRQFMNRFSELKQTFPASLAAYIAEQAASGLHYAHSFKDKITGESLNIVHRDISPQNILLSYEGTVKVIDFGIAKATTNMESTRAGVIKGKPSYLSPEQISGDVLDGRSDLFALGVVLWELLVGRKLFAGENELAVLKLIESSQTHIKPPSTYNPSVPVALDAIVMRSLSKQKEKRYQTAEEFQRVLHRFLYSAYPDFNPADLAYYAKDLFKSEIVEDRKRLQRLNEEVERILAAEEMITHHEARIFHQNEAPSDHTTTVVDSRPSIVREIEEVTKKEQVSGSIRFDQSKILPVPALPAVRQSFETKNLATGALRRENTASVAQMTQGAPTVLPYPIQEPKKSLDWRIPVGGVAVAVAAMIFTGQAKNSRKPDAVVDSGATISAPSSGMTAGKMINLHLKTIPEGVSGKATVYGRTISFDSNGTPAVVQVPADTSLELIFENPKFKAVQHQFSIDSTQNQSDFDLLIKLEPIAFGFISLNASPEADATITRGHETWVKRTPFKGEQFPSGNYTIHLRNDLLDMEADITLEVKDGETTDPAENEADHKIQLHPVSH